MDNKEKENQADSVGLVETQYLNIDSKIKLENGIEFGPLTIAYETYGKLNEQKDNAIMVFHALSGDAHAAGYNSPEDKKPGWWDELIGPKKAFDTNKYFVISSNFLGGCKGTTGPSSINPKTGRHYGITFPVITIEDMVKLQKYLIDFFEIKKFIAAGGSMGGMQAMEWAINYPDMITSTIIIASTSRLSAQGIAFNEVGRNAIIYDPNWNNGNYYEKENAPANGLSIARMIGHITYLSEESMHEKFGRKLQDKSHLDFNFDINFQVESYLRYQGRSFVDRFDANSYLYITKAMDYFDLSQKYGSLLKAFKNTKARFLVISFNSDWLFPTSQSKEIVKALMKLDKEVTYCELDTPYGHDAFLLEYEQQTKIIKSFLKKDEKNK